MYGSYSGEERRRANSGVIYRGIERRQIGNSERNPNPEIYRGTERERESGSFTCPNCGFNPSEHKSLVEKSRQAIDERTQAAEQVEAAHLKAVESKRVLDIEHAQATTDIEQERTAAGERLRAADAEVARLSDEAGRATTANASVYTEEERRTAAANAAGQFPVYAGVERRGGLATVSPAYTGPNRRKDREDREFGFV